MMTENERWQRLSSRDKAALTGFVNRLRQQFDHDNVYAVRLFGSVARGKAQAESDIDLLVVVHNYSWTLEKAITEVAVEIDLAHGVVLSDHVVDSQHFLQMVAQGVPIYRNAMKEGIDLWQMTLQPAT